MLEDELARVKEEAKDLVKNKRACVSHLPADTAINGEKSEAKKFITREIKLRIHCFDNEAKAAIAAVEWNNINRLIQRIKNKFYEINDDSRLVKIFLEQEYLDLKVLELGPGKPSDNATVESFNGRLRQECLNENWFLSLADAREKIEAWRTFYNQVRPHSALEWSTPSDYARKHAVSRRKQHQLEPDFSNSGWT